MEDCKLNLEVNIQAGIQCHFMLVNVFTLDGVAAVTFWDFGPKFTFRIAPQPVSKLPVCGSRTPLLTDNKRWTSSVLVTCTGWSLVVVARIVAL